MMFSGRSMGGGGGGGGATLRTFGRAVTRVGGNGIQEPSSSSSFNVTASTSRKPKSPTSLSTSSSVNCHTNNPVFDWVFVDGYEDQSFDGVYDSYVLGNFPSQQEVDDAIFSLQRAFHSSSYFQPNNDSCELENDMVDNVANPGLHVTTYGSETDWNEPSMSPYDARMRLSSESDVYHAFHLLQTEPTVQKMVKSLASDKAIWDAVLNNEAVREVKASFFSSDSENSDVTSSGSEPNSRPNFVKWMFDSSRAKFMELIEKITKIVTDFFQFAFHKRGEKANFPDGFTEKLEISFMLSIMVILVVMVGRAKGA